jgi:heme exporter protein C
MKTYNGFWLEDKGTIKGQLRINKNQVIPADNIVVLGDNGLSMTFELPPFPLPVDTNSLDKNKSAIFPILEVSGDKSGKASFEMAFGFQKDETLAANDAKLIEGKGLPFKKGLKFPFVNNLEESARNLYYHVPMWFGMMILLFASFWHCVLYLGRLKDENFDILGLIKLRPKGFTPKRSLHEIDKISESLAVIGTLFGILGLVTGAIWARYTWGAYWSWDVKQNMSAIVVMIYLSYFVLRSSFDDDAQGARISAVFNIFAFAALIPLLYIIPRMAQSLHPGMGGNPAFKSYDLDSMMRWVFYPSIIAWTLLGVWLAELYFRYRKIQFRLHVKSI